MPTKTLFQSRLSPKLPNGYGDPRFAAVVPDCAYPGRITTLVSATEKVTLPKFSIP